MVWGSVWFRLVRVQEVSYAHRRILQRRRFAGDEPCDPGGDALRPGRGIEVVGIHEGWQGVVDGGAKFEPFNWRSVGGILQMGGTILGTARSDAFRTVPGRRQAVRNLVNAGIDGLVVIGGDGSLTGALILVQEWESHLVALAAEGLIPAEKAENPTPLRIAGLPGSIDNDQYGTDMSIGADTALHTIVEAVDKLKSTADSHQRTFVVEVMGRRCGYLALMGAVATGADWVLIPEEEMDARWHFRMAEALKRGRAAGRRHDVILFAEGARHSDGLPIKAETITEILKNRSGLEARVTVLGHVQRGGSPTPFDRILASRLGEAAVEYLAGPDPTPVMIGLIHNAPKATPLTEMVAKSQAINTEIEQGHFDQALALRGRSFLDSLELLKTMTRAEPKQELADRGRIALLTGGPDAPGMNAVLRTALRMAMNEGQDVVGVRYGFGGLARGDVWDLQWMDVQNWISMGGSELGAIRHELTEEEISQIASQVKQWNIRGFIAVGGIATYQQVAETGRRARALPRAAHPDDLRAGDHRQQPAGHRNDHRRGHRAEQHRGGGGQDQGHGRRGAPGFHRRGDGPALRLPGPGGRHRQRRRDGAAARGRHHPGCVAPRHRHPAPRLPGGQETGHRDHR